MICFSLVHRTDTTNPGWALLVTTTESPDSPRDSVTICMVVRERKMETMVDLLKAAGIRGCSVYVEDLSDDERAGLSMLETVTIESEMPESVSTFLTLAGSAS